MRIVKTVTQGHLQFSWSLRDGAEWGGVGDGRGLIHSHFFKRRSAEAPSMEPFSAPVEEVYLLSRYRALTVAYAVSGTLVYLPSPRHREQAGRIQKDAGDELFL